MGTYGLHKGSVEIESAGPITFGPAGILFLADNGSATIFAVDVADPGAEAGPEPFDLENVDALVASYLGCEPSDLRHARHGGASRVAQRLPVRPARSR